MPRKSKNSFVKDQLIEADKAATALSITNEPHPSAADHIPSVEKTLPPTSAADGTIDAIRYEHRKRRFAMESRKAQDLRLGAFLRMMLGWRKDLPDAERKAIKDRADTIVKKPEGTEWETIVAAHRDGQVHIETVEKAALKRMEKLAETLPVWNDFGKSVRGFGSGSLATIIAETGDLSNYSSIAKVWKRLGLAVMGDVRQGGLPKGSGADAWIAHGYSPTRRSLIWNIGDTMIKAQVRREKDAAGEDTGARYALGPYGESYLARKTYELARDPEMQPAKAHRRAQRYMEKRLLKHIWQAWRRATSKVAETPVKTLSDAPIQIAA